MKYKELKGVSRDVLVHCSTEELANQVLKVAHNFGLSWRSSELFTDKNNYSPHGSSTCYDLISGEYCSMSYYLEMGKEMIEAEEFIKLNTEFVLPEKWCVRPSPDPDECKIVREWFNEQKEGMPYSCYLEDNYYWYFPPYEPNHYCLSALNGGLKERYDKITFKQFEEHVINNKNMKAEEELPVKFYPVTRDQLKEIYDIACGEWKIKISQMSIDILGPFKNEGEISEQIVESMYRAATSNQLSIIQSIFPRDVFKVGDWVYISKCENGSWGAMGKVGQITLQKGSGGLGERLFPNPIKVRIGSKVWTIGGDYTKVELRLASDKEIAIATWFKHGTLLLAWDGTKENHHNAHFKQAYNNDGEIGLQNVDGNKQFNQCFYNHYKEISFVVLIKRK